MSGARRGFRCFWLFALCLAMSARVVRVTASAEGAAYPPDAVMAAFLYRFGGFVRWPPESMQGGKFTIDVLGDDRVASDLEHMLPGLAVQGRPTAVRRISSLSELGDAQILYIGARGERTLRRMLKALGRRPVLIVTDQPGALDEGSMINFIVLGGHVRFEISLAAARQSGLRLSSELLSVATRVQGGPLGDLPQCPRARLSGALEDSCYPMLASR